MLGYNTTQCKPKVWFIIVATISHYSFKRLIFIDAGIAVHTSVEDDFWAVLVVTPIMRRAQQLESARDIIFVDSTASCDETKSNVTVLLTATKAGAVPIGVLIHSSQSTCGYEVAFRLLKHHSPLCFGNAQVLASISVLKKVRCERKFLKYL